MINFKNIFNLRKNQIAKFISNKTIFGLSKYKNKFHYNDLFINNHNLELNAGMPTFFANRSPYSGSHLWKFLIALY